ncbi:ATP-binding protein [Bacillus tianshenii]|nr:ATP-binding protein [Bacillus tianshenii]
MKRLIKKSISTRLVFIMVAIIVLTSIGAGFLYTNNKNIEREYTENIEKLVQKTNYVDQLESSLNDILFQLRGYLLFGQSDFLQTIEQERNRFENTAAKLEKLDLTLDEQKKVEEITSFYMYLFNDPFPRAIKAKQEGQNEIIQSMSKDEGITNNINYIRSISEQFTNEMEQEIYQLEENYRKQLANNQLYFIIFVLVLMAILTWITARLAKEIGVPLRQLAVASDKLANGEYMVLTDEHRKDEIGLLARSFNRMVKGIQENEQQLVAQNEELQAQQDELEEQQGRLQTTLEEMITKEGLLERRNLFTHSLANTLEQEKLLESIIHNLKEMMDADKAIVILTDNLKMKSFGVNKAGLHQYAQYFQEHLLPKLTEEKQPVVIRRNATPSEKGYHEEIEFQLEDINVPVLSFDEEIVACISLTRLGRTFSEQEVNELVGFISQVSISLDKLFMYEDSEHERIVNQQILDTMREGIQFVDREGNIVQTNQQFCDLLECEPSKRKELRKREQWFRYLEKKIENPDSLLKFMEHVLEGRTTDEQRINYEVNHQDKQIIQVYVEKIFQKDEWIGTIFVHRDITREYEVDQMKSEFVSTVSHELRTPLSSVLGFTELMLNKTLKPERQKKYLETIHKEAKRLTALINDFLDVQRMESGRQVYEKEIVEVKHLLEDVIEKQAVNTKNHAFHIDIHTTQTSVFGDVDKIRQVFTNILNNAVKYSPDGGKIDISVEADQEQILIHIKDEGLGIPKEALSKLFTKFYRIDNTDRRQIGGTGLGLAISKEIMKAHNGDIQVSSELGQGSTFTLIFPVIAKSKVQQAIPEQSSEQQPLPAHQQDKPNLLIVEDDKSLALLLKDEMKESGFIVEHCTTGSQAIDLIKRKTPDAIVVDIMLDDSIDGGWHVIEEIKKHEATKNVPIFISSALDEKERGLQLGAKYYFTKPYKPQELSSLIKKVLEEGEKQGQILIPNHLSNQE